MDEYKKYLDEAAKYEQAYSEYAPIDREALMRDLENRGGSPVMQIFQKHVPPPTRKITPEQAKRARFASALTDSITSLAEMFAHGQGARVRARSGNTNSRQTNERIREMEEKYDRDLLNWQSGLYNAAHQDLNQLIASAQAERGEKRQYLLHKASAARAAASEALKTQRMIEAAKRKEADKKEYAQWELENIFKPKEILRAQNRQKAAATRAAGGSGYVDLQDGRNNYVRLPKSVWEVAAQDLYGEMVRSGAIAKLMRKKNYSFEPDVEETSPGAIEAYVARNVGLISPAQWDKLKARAEGRGYMAPTADVPASPAVEQQREKLSTLTPPARKTASKPAAVSQKNGAKGKKIAGF